MDDVIAEAQDRAADALATHSERMADAGKDIASA
jgi:hypothetical protein